MSANTELKIKKEKNLYVLKLRDVDVGNGMLIGKYKTLEEAIKRANKYREEEPVEYGLLIDIK